MKRLIGFLGLTILLVAGGCAVEPIGHPYGSVSVGVSGEYPSTYYGSGYYPYRTYRPYRYYGRPRWRHPYDRDYYFHRHYDPRYRSWAY